MVGGIVLYTSLEGYDGEADEPGGDYGVCPIIKLKQKIKTSGKNDDGEWILENL